MDGKSLLKAFPAIVCVIFTMLVILVSCTMSQDLYDYHQRSAGDGDDTTGISIDVGDGLVTREDPATPLSDTFFIKLKGEPSGDVVLGTIQSMSLDEVDVSPSSLTFTQSNWDVAQAVTVTGVDDGIADNVQIAVIDLGILSGGGYDGYDPGDVTVQNLDDETAGSPAVILMNDGLVTDESGAVNDFFSVVLNEPPAASVDIGTVASTDTGEVTVSPSSLTFTTANWNTPQNVNLNGVNDAVFDGIQMVTIDLGSTTSTDPNWDGIVLGSVTAYNLDDDGPKGITVLAGTTNYVGEGTVSQFEVVLDAQPSADVTITVSSSNGEATVAPSSLTFTAGNWNTPQTLTVTGVDDAEADGSLSCNINLSAASSGDTEYNGMSPTPSSIPYEVLDNDSAGITLTAGSMLSVSESGAFSTFDIFLNSEPSDNVTLSVSSSNIAEATVVPASLTFTPANWNNPQSVTVTGVDDGVVDGNQPLDIVIGAATSLDGNYSGMNPNDIPCINIDNDSNKNVLILAGPSTLVSESGGFSEFEVVLTEVPAANVTVAVSSDDTAEGTVSPASLTFLPGNWDVRQTVQVYGVDDDREDGNGFFSVNFSVTSSDTDYDGLPVAPLAFENVDDDSAGITVRAGTTMLVSESGTSSSFEVVLNSEPTDTVDIGIHIQAIEADEAEITAPFMGDAGTLSFNAGNWQNPQTVVVQGEDDDVVDNNQPFTVFIDADVTTLDTTYNGLAPSDPDIDFINTDNDSVGVTVDIGDGLITDETGGTDSFQIVLNSEPSGTVTIDITSSDAGEATVNPTSVSFNAGTWLSPVTVTVTGVDDFTYDSLQSVTIALDMVAGADANYNAVDPDDVTVHNIDDESFKQVIILANPEGYCTSENGATTQIAVVLSEQPADDVTLGTITTFPLGEGSVSPNSLIFTSSDWNIPHIVTVTGVSDGGKGDGKQYYDVDLGSTSSVGDATWNGIAGGSVTVTNLDRMLIDDYVWTPPTPVPFGTISGSGTPIAFRHVDFNDGYIPEDEGYEIIPIGFPFYYMGLPHHEIMVFTNGFASFNPYLNNHTFWNDALIIASDPDADLFVDILSPWWDDLHTSLAGGAVYYETSGVKPNRVFTVEWWNAIYAAGGSDDTYTFQIKLHEDSNIVEFCYGPVSGGPPDNTTASVGINDSIPGDGHFIDGLNGAMFEAGSSFDYGFSDFPTNALPGESVVLFDPN